MEEAIIQRVVYGDHGVFGVFIRNDKPLFTTLELPWKNNKHDISCIPAGTYTATRMMSVKFSKYVYVLHDVPNRNFIELHIANTIEDLKGCIAVGISFSSVEYAIMSSQVAFDNLMYMMPKEGFKLTVRDLNHETGTITSDQI